MKASIGIGIALLGILAVEPGAAAELQPIARALSQPIGIANAGDGSGRLFFLEQAGRIRVHDGARVLPTPFLDLAGLVTCCGERGLLGLAFHPDYETNRRFYVNYTNTAGDTVIARYLASSDPNRADAGSGAILLTIPQPFSNHNGGHLAFGPDGNLYVGTGDGGSGGDPQNHGQNLGSLLGKLLRIDVDGAAPYAIPPGNPFVSLAGARPEIWSYGLRNPWRFSFDRRTGDLFIGDVGQNAIEEVDFQASASAGGENYGWRRMEGTHCYNPSQSCNDGSLTLPVLEYDHALGCSVTGGYRYRGAAVAPLAGQYLYGDYCSGRIWAATEGAGQSFSSDVLLDTSFAVSSFGEDEAGELYVADYSGGAVYKLVNDGTVLLAFGAASVLVPRGGSALLSWAAASNAALTLDGGSLSGATGSVTRPIDATTSFTLAGSRGGQNETRSVTVHADDGTAALPAPAVTAPLRGESVSVTGVSFGWSAVSGATGYELAVWRALTGATVFSGALAGAGATSTLIGLPAGSYRFAIRACSGGTGAALCGPYGGVEFHVNLAAPATAPTVLAPAQGAVLTASTQALSWSAVAPAAPGMTYEVLLADKARGTTALQIAVPHPQTSTIFSLRSSASYELKVRACHAACGPFSAPVGFSVALPSVPASAPTITRATAGAELDVEWTSVSGADLYQVQVVQPGAGPGGGALSVAARQTSSTSSVFPVPAGPASVVVAACNGDGCGPFSSAVPVNGAANPALPQLGTPMAGTVVAGPSVLLTWSRVPGDNGSNTTYRLFVQDLSRQATALDVHTTSNFHAAYFKAEGARYDALVIANPGLSGQTAGPAVGFNVSGSSSAAPTLVGPAHQSAVTGGNVLLLWSPVPGATLYEYFVAVPGEGQPAATGVTTGLFVRVPLLPRNGQPTVYSAIVRACPAGAACAPGGNSGWGPWSVDAGPGVTNFTVLP